MFMCEREVHWSDGQHLDSAVAVVIQKTKKNSDISQMPLMHRVITGSLILCKLKTSVSNDI